MPSPGDDFNRLHGRAIELAPGWFSSIAKSLMAPVIGILLALFLHYGLNWLETSGVLYGSIAELAGRAAYYRQILAGVGIAVILGVSLNIVNGYTGQFALGHAGFMALGGYAAGTITYYGSFYIWGDVYKADLTSTFTQGHLLFIPALLIGGLVAAVAGYAVGLPSLRLRGDYLAIVTLGFGEIVSGIIQLSEPVLSTKEEIDKLPWWKLPGYVGGSLGFFGPPSLTRIFWIWIFVALTVIVAYRLKFSSQGRAFLSIRENEIAAEAMGVPVTRYKVRAFVIAAFFAGIAGGLFAHNLGNTLSPGELGFGKSIEIVILVVLGGTGSISGTVIAAVILTILPERFRDFQQYSLLAYAAALILIMLLRPKGLLGVREIWQVNLGWLYRGLAAFVGGYILLRLIYWPIGTGWTLLSTLVFTAVILAHFAYTHLRMLRINLPGPEILPDTAPGTAPTPPPEPVDHSPWRSFFFKWLWIPLYIFALPTFVYATNLASESRWVDVLFYAIAASTFLHLAVHMRTPTRRPKGVTR
jgi:branched-chain amino acid transport system permease protein